VDAISASQINPPPVVTGPTPEDIRKVVAEHQAKESRKSKNTDTEKDKDKDKDKDKKKEDKESPKPKPTSPALVPAIPTSPPVASHRKFALHRQVFDMRKAEIKRREQGVKAKEVSKGELNLKLVLWSFSSGFGRQEGRSGDRYARVEILVEVKERRSDVDSESTSSRIRLHRKTKPHPYTFFPMILF